MFAIYIMRQRIHVFTKLCYNNSNAWYFNTDFFNTDYRHIYKQLRCSWLITSEILNICLVNLVILGFAENVASQYLTIFGLKVRPLAHSLQSSEYGYLVNERCPTSFMRHLNLKMQKIEFRHHNDQLLSIRSSMLSVHPKWVNTQLFDALETQFYKKIRSKLTFD